MDRFSLQVTHGENFTNPFNLIPVPAQTNVDIVALSIGAGMVGVNFISMFLVLSKYKRLAVRTKQPFLMLLTLFFNAMLYFGYAVGFWIVVMKRNLLV